MEAMNWPPEHSAVLRDLRARGMSYGKIAETINARFNTAYTRSAALGRAQRMGLGGLERTEPSLPGHLDPPKPSLPEPPSMGRPGEVRFGPRFEPRFEPSIEPRIDLLRWPRIFAEPVEMPELRCADVAPRHLSLIELESRDCRYPYGGDSEGETITFCGHPRQPGSRYCTAHFRLSRDPVASARSVLSDAWLAAIGVA